MAQYPGAIPTLDNPTSTTYEDDIGFFHDTQHANANDEIEAIATELGTNPSAGFSTVKARLDDVDTRLGNQPVYVGAVAPSSPQDGWVWIDTSGI